MRIAALCALFGGALSVSAQPAAKNPFIFDAMMKLARIDDPQLSPDGKTVAFTVQTVDLPNNTKPTQIYVVPVDGGTPQRLTNDGNLNTWPRWTPDSKRIVFVSDRSNGSQIWSMKPDGSEARPVTNLPTGADGVTVSPDGKLILVVSDLYPECEPPSAVRGLNMILSVTKRSSIRMLAARWTRACTPSFFIGIGRNTKASGDDTC